MLTREEDGAREEPPDEWVRGDPASKGARMQAVHPELLVHRAQAEGRDDEHQREAEDTAQRPELNLERGCRFKVHL